MRSYTHYTVSMTNEERHALNARLVEAVLKDDGGAVAAAAEAGADVDCKVGEGNPSFPSGRFEMDGLQSRVELSWTMTPLMLAAALDRFKAAAALVKAGADPAAARSDYFNCGTSGSAGFPHVVYRTVTLENCMGRRGSKARKAICAAVYGH